MTTEDMRRQWVHGLRYNDYQLGDLPLVCRDDPDIVAIACATSYFSFRHATPRLKANRAFILRVVRVDMTAFEYAALEFRRDRQVVLAAVSSVDTGGHYGAYSAYLPFVYVAPELQLDRGVVLAAVATHPYTLNLVDARFRADEEVVLAAVRTNGMMLAVAHPTVCASRAVVRVAVAQRAGSFVYASDELRADRAFILSLVPPADANNRVGVTFEFDTDIFNVMFYAAPTLRADRAFVVSMMTATGDVTVLKAAATELRADREFVRAVVARWGDALQFATPEVRADRAVVLAAVRNSGRALAFAACTAGYSRCDDRELVRVAVATYGSALRWAAFALRFDRDIVTTAVVQDRSVLLELVPPDMKQDLEVVRAAVNANRRALLYFDAAVRRDPAWRRMGRMQATSFLRQMGLPQDVISLIVARLAW